jgi:hypothetical protein
MPQPPFGYSLLTAVPIIESAAFIGAGLFALRYQRYVLVPMAAAFTRLISHLDVGLTSIALTGRKYKVTTGLIRRQSAT